MRLDKSFQRVALKPRPRNVLFTILREAGIFCTSREATFTKLFRKFFFNFTLKSKKKR